LLAIQVSQYQQTPNLNAVASFDSPPHLVVFCQSFASSLAAVTTSYLAGGLSDKRCFVFAVKMTDQIL
jgi:hypothetical protein